MTHRDSVIHQKMRDKPEECLSDSNQHMLMNQTDFESMIISVKNLHTVISLLKCEELDIIVATLDALSKFIGKSSENIVVLLDHHVLEDIMPFIEHKDLIIRRFSTKLFAEMTILEIGRNIILRDKNKIRCLHRFMEILHGEDDAVVEGHLLRILGNFCDDVFGSYQILESQHLGELLKGFESMDPDVRKGSLEVVGKLMGNPMAVERFYAVKEFNFELFYDVHYEDDIFPEVTIFILKNFLTQVENKNIHRDFRESGGLEKFLEIFRDDLSEELHPSILELLVVATANYETAKYFNFLISSEEISEFLEMFEDSGDPLVLRLISNLSAISEFRKTVHDLGIIQFISRNLNAEINPETINPICLIIEYICHMTRAMNELIQVDMTGRLLEQIKSYKKDIYKNIDISLRSRDIEALLIPEILKAKKIYWKMKEDVLSAIKELVTRNHRNGERIINSEDHLSLIKLAQNESVPMQMRLGCLNIVNVLINFPKFRCSFMSLSIIDMLSSFFKEKVIDELKISTLSIFSHLFIEEESRKMCLRTDFIEKLCPLICTEHSLPVQSSAILLIQQLCCDETLIDEFVRFGYLNILMENRKKMQYVIPSWETCLETMLSGHLPLKFDVTGHLSLHDVTRDGFYVVKRHSHSFPSLKELFASRCSPIECIYTINFGSEVVPGDSAESSVHWTETFEDDNSTKICFSVTDSISCGEKFGRLRHDPGLCQHFNMFLKILQTSDSCFLDSHNVIDISRIESRAKLLAKFVAHVLSTVDESDDESVEDKLKNHLQELRETLETSIIPLGELRFGSYLERAILFKAIGDRICLPVALVRGEYGKSWVQIAIPQCHPKTSRNILPMKLLHPNYIVDLMENPGELIPIGSNKARKFYEYQPIFSVIK